MAHEITQAVLEEVARRILEETAFIFAEPADEAAELGGGLAVAIRFGGPAEGRFVLRTSLPFAVELAGNMLGVEPDDPEAEANAGHAFAELMNILAGALVHELFGSGVVCNLGIPEHLDETSAGGANVSVPLLTDEGHPLELHLFLDAA